jgi:hypothetical protein
MRAKNDCYCAMYLDGGRHYAGCIGGKLVNIADMPPDKINPPHYTAHPSKIECIQITEHMSFCLGNAIKYIWRADLMGEAL